MGKGGRKAKASAGTTLTDDELLDQAVAENKKAAALALQQAQMKLEEDSRGCPTKQELLAALDNILLFDLRHADGEGRQPCLSPQGEYVLYTDEADAVAAIEALKKAQPGSQAVLGCTGLGRAFALSEGKAFGFSSNFKHPIHLQGSTALLAEIGAASSEALCPAAVREQLNARTSIIPMFSMPELINNTEAAPYFFSKADMVTHWMSATGKAESQLPPTIVLTDLRVLIVRMMQNPRDWRTIQLVPSAQSIEWLHSVTANQKMAAMVKEQEEAKARAEGKAAASAPAAAVPDEDAKLPPLQEEQEEGAEPPPLA